MAGVNHQKQLDITKPSDALEFIKLSVESDNFRGTGRQHMLMQQSLETLNNLVNELASSRAEQKPIQNSKSK